MGRNLENVRHRWLLFLFWASLAILIVLLGGCGQERPVRMKLLVESTERIENTSLLTPQAVGAGIEGRPWMTHATVVDLDGDGLADILACDGKLDALVWVRQVSPGVFEESVVMDGLQGIVRVEAADIDGDGDVDLLIACMGQIFPNNEKIGSVVILENVGNGEFAKRVIAEGIARVTDVRAGDFNGNGRMDLAVAQFGYDEGEVRWMENKGGWEFESHILLRLSGAVNVLVDDFNGDGRPDIVALISQQWEEIYLFENRGEGRFGNRVIWGSSNEDFGSSGITLCDLNQDGLPDILYTNGDGFDYAEPGPRPWHGVQWLENLGGGNFRYHHIGEQAGAYSPVALDIDGDGDIDVVAVSGFNDWSKPDAVSMMLYRNNGMQQFQPEILSFRPSHLIAATAGDLDGDGRDMLITCGFHAYPPYDHMSRLLVWRPAAD